MPRSISNELKADFASTAQTICTCLRIIRRDGLQLGFTTCDEGFDYELITNPDAHGSLFYSSIGSFEPSTLRNTEGTGVDNQEILGSFSADTITATDLIAGKYGDAEITIFMVNYEELSHGEIIKLSGFIGEAVKMDGIFKVEILAKNSRLKRYIGIATSITCRIRQFGNNQCKLSAASYTQERTILSSASRQVLRIGEYSHPEGYYANGVCTFTSGLNDGVSREIKKHTIIGGEAEITFNEVFPFNILPGDTATFQMGCNRTLAFCRTLNNAKNFRGEPFLPGNSVTTKIGRAPVEH